MKEYSGVFLYDLSDGLLPFRALTHPIHLVARGKPIAKLPYWFSHSKVTKVKCSLAEYLEETVHSSSPMGITYSSCEGKIM